MIITVVTPTTRAAYAAACYAGSAMGTDAVNVFLADGNAGEAIHYLTPEHLPALAARTPKQAVAYCRRVLADAMRAEADAERLADEN